MNWKSTWVLWSMVAVLFAFIALIEHPIRKERNRPVDHHILPGLNPAAITNVEIQPWEQAAIAAERPGPGKRWRLRRPISYPAQSELINGLLEQLAQLQWQQRITEEELKGRPDALDGFGLTKPRCSILLQGGGSSRRLDVGEQTAYGDQVFFSVVGGASVYLASSNVLAWIPLDKTFWRNRTLLDLAETPFNGIEAEAEGEEFYLERDPTNHLWLMTKPQAARADTPKVNDLLKQLQQMRIRAFLADDAQSDSDTYGFQAGHVPDLTLTFYAGTNAVAGLQVGAAAQGMADMVFARRNSPSNIVLVSRAPLLAWEAPYTNFLDQHFISIPPQTISSIQVEGIDRFEVQRQTNNQWLVEGKETFPADADLMQDWLNCMTNIQTDIKKTVVADLSQYGLARPLLRYALEVSRNGKSMAGPRLEFGTNGAGQVFERRPDEAFVNTISREDFERLPRVSWELRDRRIWNFAPSNVVSVTVHQMGAERGYVRDPLGQWTFAPGFHAPPYINSPEFQEAIYRLGHLKAIYWDATGNDPRDLFGFKRTDHWVELKVRQGNAIKTLRVDFGDRSPYLHPYAAIERGGERLIFEFPADLYDNFVQYDLSVPAAFWHRN